MRRPVLDDINLILVVSNDAGQRSAHNLSHHAALFLRVIGEGRPVSAGDNPERPARRHRIHRGGRDTDDLRGRGLLAGRRGGFAGYSRCSRSGGGLRCSRLGGGGLLTIAARDIQRHANLDQRRIGADHAAVRVVKIAVGKGRAVGLTSDALKRIAALNSVVGAAGNRLGFGFYRGQACDGEAKAGGHAGENRFTHTILSEVYSGRIVPNRRNSCNNAATKAPTNRHCENQKLSGGGAARR